MIQKYIFKDISIRKNTMLKVKYLTFDSIKKLIFLIT
jgi:hypothetical protein